MSTVPRTRPLLLVAAVLLALIALGAPSAGAQTGDGDGAGTLTLLHNNDGESTLLPLTNVVETDGGTVDVPVGGIAAFATLTGQQIAEARLAGNAVLNVYAGDAFVPSATLICTQTPGNPSFDAVAQAQLPYDAHIFGNHEFDYGPDFLEAFIRAFEGQPFLSANLDFSGEPGFADLIDEDGLIEAPIDDGRVIGRAMVITDPETGQRFGIVGATTPSLPTSSSPGNVAVTPDLATTAVAVQAEIDRLYDDLGVRKIIFVSHLQSVANDIELIAMLSRVDIAVAGGGDELLQNPDVAAELQLVPGEPSEVVGTYPLETTDADGRTVYVVTTAGNYRYAGRIDAIFDDEGEIAEIVTETSYPRPVVPESEAAAAVGFAGAVAEDPAILASVIDQLTGCLADLATTPVAETEVLLDLARETTRSAESNAGNLIADAFLAAYDREAAAFGLDPRGDGNPVIALQNGGGIRDDVGKVLPRDGVVPGTIYRLDTFNTLPFDNFITVVQNVTPEDVHTIFEQSVSNLPFGGGFMQVAGVRVVYDLGQPPGARVVSVTLEDGTPIITDGEVVAGAPAITVVTHSFTAAGGDGYEVFATNPDATRLPVSYEEAFRLYLAELGTVSADDPRYQPGGEGRISFQTDEPSPTPTAEPETPTATAEPETPTAEPETPTVTAPTATPTAAAPEPTATAPAPTATPTRVAPAPPDSGSGFSAAGGQNIGLLVMALLVLAAGGTLALTGRWQRR